MFETKGIDVAEVYSQPRVTQDAAIRDYDGVRLEPGWSLGLTRNDPTTGQPRDWGKVAVRDRVRKLINDTKPFLMI